MTTPITAIVVSKNEAHLLKACLASLSFCKEILVIDLHSTDTTLQIALQFGARVIRHEPVSHVEMIHTKIPSFTNNHWIITADPDEVVSEGLKHDIISLFQNQIPSNVGAINVPIKFFFKSSPLSGTIWGGDNKVKQFIVNLEGLEFNSFVHKGRKLKWGYTDLTISPNKTKTNFLNHYWISSYRQLFEKHLRYLSLERFSMRADGLTFNRIGQLKNTIHSILSSFIDKEGYRDGITGIFLSLFWGWYTFMKWESLRSHEKSH